MVDTNTIHKGDALSILKTLPDECVDCCVTSPPYWGLRDYGVEGQLGLEKTPEEYVQKMVEVFREVKRVLRDDGTLWLNLGDSYNGSGKAGSNPEYQAHHTEFGKQSIHESRFGMPTNVKTLKPKDLVGIPWMTAFALRADGWYLRSDIIWSKPNPMPESVTDRCTKSHEYIFLLTKSPKYYYDAEAIKEPSIWSSIPNKRYVSNAPHGSERPGGNKKLNIPNLAGRNKRSVWTINTKPYSEAHFATFPPELPSLCIKAGCPLGGIVLDPFMGSGTTAQEALKQRKKFIGVEINQAYIELASKRLKPFLEQTFLA